MSWLLALFTLFVTLLAYCLAADELWVLDEENDDTTVIRRMTLPSETPTTFDIDYTDLTGVSYIDYDSTNDDIYFGHTNSPRYLAKVSESDPTTVRQLLTETTNPGDFGPNGITFDPVTDTIYYADYYGDSIVAVNVNGNDVSSRTVIANGTAGLPRDLDIDYNLGLLFWTEKNAPAIKCSMADGTGTATVASGLNRVKGIAVDMTDKYAYWCDYHDDGTGATLNRAQYSSDGCAGTFTPTVVHTFATSKSCRDVAVGADTVYFIQFDETDDTATAYNILSFPKAAIDDAETTIPDSSFTIVPMTFTSDNYPMALALNLDTPVTVDSPCAAADACDAGMTCATVPAGHACLCADGAADCTDQEVVVDDTRPGANGPSAPGGGNGNGNGSGTTAEPRSNAIRLSTGFISLLVAAIMIIM